MEIQGFATGPYKTNCYLLIEDGRCVVVDAGMHAFAPVMDVLGKLDLELEAVVCTHGHIDHTRDAAQLANHFGVPVYIHPDDRFMLAGGDGVLPETARLFDAAPRPSRRRCARLTTPRWSPSSATTSAWRTRPDTRGAACC